jgi:hypothetical protein
MRKVTKKWKMKDGTKIRICDMTDLHLVNAMMVVENHARRVYNQDLSLLISMPEMQGEQAQVSQDNNLKSVLAEFAEKDYLPDIYYDLQNETYRRIAKENKK